MQAVVGQPIQLEVAQLFQDADRVLRVREAGAEQGLDVVESDLDLIDLAQQVADSVQAGATAGQGLLEASLGGVELALRQIRLRFVVRADGVKGISFGQPGEGPQRGVGAAAECLADPQPVIGRASQAPGRAAKAVSRRCAASNWPRAISCWASRSSPRALQASSRANRTQARAKSTAAMPSRRQRRRIRIMDKSSLIPRYLARRCRYWLGVRFWRRAMVV